MSRILVYLAGVAVPQPVPDLGVERVRFALAPRGHAVVEPVEVLCAVVHRSEGLHRDLLAVGRLADAPLDVVERDVEPALTLPLADECGEENVNSMRVKLNHLQWRIMKVSPQTYGDRVRTEVTGADGGPIKTESKIDISGLDFEELEALEKALTKTGLA